MIAKADCAIGEGKATIFPPPLDRYFLEIFFLLAHMGGSLRCNPGYRRTLG